MEQESLFKRFTFGTCCSGWGATNNPAQATNARITSYLCPSSPTGDVVPSPPPGGSNIQANHYVAVTGAVPGLIPGFNETRYFNNNGSAGCCSGGIASAGGAIVPGIDVKLALNQIPDGTTNTIFVSEQNDFLTTVNGTKVKWSAGMLHGWLIGWHTTRTPINGQNIGDARTFQMTTIRYTINRKTGWPNAPGNCGSLGVCDNMGTNIPLNSAHSGGVNALMGDGSVRFLRDSIPIANLARLATRDDGQSVPND